MTSAGAADSSYPLPPSPAAPAAKPLLIVKTGSTFEALRAQQGDFDDWIARGLGPHALPVLVVDRRTGAPLPEPSELRGIVITGSHEMVSHRAEWSERTAAWLARCVESGVPVLGICYGHQLLAHALGGEVDFHPGGLEIGTVPLELAPAARDDPLFAGLPQRFAVNVIHRQSALRLPPGAVPLATNAHEPHHAFRVGRCAWGVQFHPEFDANAMRGYVQAHAAQLDDAAAIEDRVRSTPEAASLLQRFGQLTAHRNGQQTTWMTPGGR
ncbi:glutamine amidotransferase [Pseudacidovorax sp. RU35E]|uniref:glutamine amidotransferase n=1 Tax=Pseudacidovorax sp. RU35E TaxID=1907403 RepID=UPI0009551151|nr:glutamine amidotransferase [Pseudacidovorax sp. RU35E]SIR31497.1 GMP synthase (glutamine-hydrolysing) [Pseudacidovorax sp. RU35E]